MFEWLERRELLALTPLPPVGNQFGNPIVISTDGLGANALTIVLSDTLNPGQVTATINGNSYTNFNNQIKFSGIFGGTDVNAVAISTPFGVDLGNGGNSYAWNSVCDFTPAGLPDVTVALTYADDLTVDAVTGTSAAPSTIVGTFQTRVAPAKVTLNSTGVISVLAAGVDAAALALNTTVNAVPSGVAFSGPVKVSSALTVTSKTDLVVDQPLTASAGGTITLQSTAGLVDVNKTVTAGGAITVAAAQALTIDDAVESIGSTVDLSALTAVAVNRPVTANNNLTVLGVNGITIAAAAPIVSAAGGIDLKSVGGFVRVAGGLKATVGVIGVQAAKLDADLAAVTAGQSLTVTANTDVTLNGPTDIVAGGSGAVVTITATTGDVELAGPTTVLGTGGMTVAAANKVTFDGTVTLLGLGNLDATATSGPLAVAPLAAITLIDGTTTLTAVAGTATIEAPVVGNKTITIKAAQGLQLSNAVDPAAEVRATGPLFNVDLSTNANQILVDAPVSALGGDVTITATLDDIVIRDDLYALNGLAVKSQTGLLVDGVAPGLVTIKADTGKADLVSTAASVTVGPNAVVATGVGATANVAITAAKVVDLKVPIVANGAIAITSPDQFVVQKLLTSDLNTITISAANGPITSVLAPLTAGTALTLNALNDITLDNTLTSTGAGVNVVSKSGTVTTQAGCVLAAPAIGLGVVGINAGTFAMGNHIVAGGDIVVQTVTTFTPTKNFTSNGGDISIAVSGGSLDLSASTASALVGDVTLAAAGAVTYTMPVTGPAGSFSVTGGSTVTPIGPITVGGSIQLTTGAAFVPVVGQNLTALNGSISVTASGGVDITNISVAAPLGSVSLTSKTGNLTVGAAPNVIAVSTAPGVGSITLSAPMGAVTVGQDLAAGGNIAIASFGPYTSTFKLTANGDVAISTSGAGGFVKLDAPAVAGNDLLIATGGSGGFVKLDAPAKASNHVSITTTGAGGLIDVTNPAGVITATTGSITLTSAADEVDLGPLNPLLAPGGAIVVSSAKTLDVDTVVTAVVGTVTLASTAGDVFVKTNLTAGPSATLTINAAGEINNGTPNGAVAGTWVKAGTFDATAGFIGPSFPKFQFTNPLNAIGDLTVTLTKGDGVNFINSGAFGVTALANDTGAVSLASVAGAITTAPAIGTGASEFLDGITLTAPGGVTVGGGLNTAGKAPGHIVVTSMGGPIAVGGPVTSVLGKIVFTAGAGVNVTGNVTTVAQDITVTAGAGAVITGAITAFTDVAVSAGTAITLGTSSSGTVIAAATGSVNVTSVAGAITVDAAITAVAGSIQIVTPNTLAFSGSALTAARPYVVGPPLVGLVKLDAAAMTITGTPPVVTAGRFEVGSLGAGPISFLGFNAVDSLKVATAGSFTFNNFSNVLELTDFNPLAASVQVTTGGDLTIVQGMAASTGGGRLRVIDGIACGGKLSLSAAQSPLGVEFVTTSAVDNVTPAFAGTLRDMLGYINANVAVNGAGTSNADMSAVFDEPGSPVSLAGTFTPAVNLPAIAKRITLDGTLLPAAPGVSVGGIVGIDGMLVPAPSATGLTLAAGSAGSVLRDAAIHAFTGTGIAVNTADNHLTGLYVGLDRNGLADGNGVGIDIANSDADRNVVGVRVAGDLFNLVAANTGTGIQIRGGADYTQVYGNFIGFDLTAAVAPNGGDGISIDSSIGTEIGSPLAAHANVIGNSGNHGVRITDVQGVSPAYGAQVVNNTIINSQAGGVTIQGGGRNKIGGTATGEGNAISGNFDGIRLVASLNGTSSQNIVAGNSSVGNVRDGVRIIGGSGNRVDGNVVSQNGDVGVRVHKASQPNPNRIINNEITSNGNAVLNGGIVISHSALQLVGVTVGNAAAANDVSNNGGSGIVVIGSAPLAADGNTIAFNTVDSNAFDGIRVQGGITNSIRANFVNSNLATGIAIVDAVAATTTKGNAVTANAVGGNGIGVSVEGGARNVLGGDLPSLGNRVFSSKADGIVVKSSAGTGAAIGTVIRNNWIGLDAGNAAAGNGGVGIRTVDTVGTTIDFANVVRNNTGGGIVVGGGNSVTIGSAVVGRGNVVSNNGGDGILVDQPAVAPAMTEGVTIAGNTIESNGGFGVSVVGARTTGVVIGRKPSVTMPNGTGNTIRLCTGGGIQVNGAQAVTIIGNQTIGNIGPQISLIGGANGGIQAPFLSSARARVPGQKTPQYEVRGTLNYGAAFRGQRFYVDFYGNRDADGKQFYLGRLLVTIGANGGGSFRTIVNGGVGGVPTIVATATLASSLFGGTSAFSNAVATT